MTAEPDLLPLPWIERYAVVGDIAYPVSSDPDGDYVAHDDHTDAMQAYARANLAELQREVEGLRAEVALLTHKVITCGVAADHPDANLTRTGAYASKWDSPQAERVRVLRDRAERLAEALRIAIRQNSHDMLMTGDELRQCEAALNPTAAQENDDA